MSAIDWTEIGRRVALHRQSAGLTQVQLAERTAVSRTTISQLEAGRQHVHLDTLASIASALHASVADLLGVQALNRPVMCRFKIDCGHGPHQCSYLEGHEGPHRSLFGCSAPNSAIKEPNEEG